jgi:8-oxo-dGTP diphosphatase
MTSDGDVPLECVAFMLIANGRVLAERRKLNKSLAPGAVALPGGHMEGDEGPKASLERELREELGITARRVAYVCSLLHRAEELRRIHYFAVEGWEGEIRNLEAEALAWIGLDETDRLDLDIDRVAVREYLRVYRAV